MENTYIEFTQEEFDEILEYMDKCEAETIQQAILKAIRDAK